MEERQSERERETGESINITTNKLVNSLCIHNYGRYTIRYTMTSPVFFCTKEETKSYIG